MSSQRVTKRSKAIQSLCLTGASIALATGAGITPTLALAASDYPCATIKLVIPYPPGGPTPSR